MSRPVMERAPTVRLADGGLLPLGERKNGRDPTAQVLLVTPILALDLGTTTGWALRWDSTHIASGAESSSPPCHGTCNGNANPGRRACNATAGAGIRCDVAKLPPLAVKGEPNAVFVAPTRGYRDKPVAAGPGDEVEHTREEYYAQVRVQQVLFGVAQEIVDDLVGGFAKHENKTIEKALLARHQIFPDVLKIVEEYVATKVTFAKGVDARELALSTHKKKLRERLRSAIVPAAGKASLRPVINSYHPITTTAKVNYATTRPVVPLTKSHLNCAVLRSSLERDAIEVLEELDVVEAFAPNDRQVGFQITYEYGGGPHLYEPDFLVRVRGCAIVLLEMKGLGGLIHDEDSVNAKNDGARKWVEAVNNTKTHGTWAFELCDDLKKLAAQLERHASPLAQAPRPFRIVESGPKDRFRTCVPLTTLRVAAGRFSDEQSNLDTQGECPVCQHDPRHRLPSI